MPTTRLALALRLWLSDAPLTPGFGSASSQIPTAPLADAVWRPTRVSGWLSVALPGSGFQVIEVTVVEVLLRLTMTTRRSVPAGRLKLVEPALLEVEAKLLTAPPSRLTGTSAVGVALRSFEPAPVPTALTAATW